MSEPPQIFINPESPLYSFSSGCNSPTIQLKYSNIPFEFTETTRPGSFVSNQTPMTRLASLSNTQEQLPKLRESSLARLHQKMSKIKEEYEATTREHDLRLDIPERITDDQENGIPTLRWCAFCRCETTTEVFYENSGTTFWSSVAIFVAGGMFGCCLVPYMMDSCKNTRTRCHRCKHVNNHVDLQEQE